MPSVLKYCAPKDHYFETLYRNQINLSHPRYLNDEYELADYLIEPYKDFCEAINWKADLKAFFDDQAIGSFTNSETPTNDTLWERYADNCHGFAVEYDKDVLTEGLFNQYVRPYHLQDVEYMDQRLNLDDFGIKFTVKNQTYTIQKCIEKKSEGDYKLLDGLFCYLRLIKERNLWQGEDESRIIIGNRNLNRSKYLHPNQYGYTLDLPPGTIKAIFIGKNMSRHDRVKLLCIARHNNIPCKAL